MNSSLPRAAERRADAAQSIHATSSPARYSRVLAMSEPTPRRALRTPPKARPITRRRGTSGKTAATGLGARRCRDVEIDVEAGLRCFFEAAVANLARRRLPAAVADLREKARAEENAMEEHGHEQLLHVLRRDVAPRVQYGPGARGTVEGERAPDGAADRDDLEVSRR